jgi:hypothetical protein
MLNTAVRGEKGINFEWTKEDQREDERYKLIPVIITLPPTFHRTTK